MNIIKKTTYIIIIALTGMALLSSCSKEPEATEARKGKKTPAAAKAKTTPAPVLDTSKNTLNAIRSGQYVDLNWHIETSPGKKIMQLNIIRSSTGKMKQSLKVASLDPKTTAYRDSLPDGNAQWYWMRIIMSDGTYPLIGPVRVDRDANQLANYSNPEDDYKAVVTRTDNAATLSWDFPAGEFQVIRIVRSPKPLIKFDVNSKDILLKSLERKSQYTDVLPDANADYWYLFQVVTKSGAVINKGPVKAEYN